jgi:hypothetical protein
MNTRQNHAELKHLLKMIVTVFKMS